MPADGKKNGNERGKIDVSTTKKKKKKKTNNKFLLTIRKKDIVSLVVTVARRFGNVPHGQGGSFYS